MCRKPKANEKERHTKTTKQSKTKKTKQITNIPTNNLWKLFRTSCKHASVQNNHSLNFRTSNWPNRLSYRWGISVITVDTHKQIYPFKPFFIIKQFGKHKICQLLARIYDILCSNKDTLMSGQTSDLSPENLMR